MNGFGTIFNFTFREQVRAKGYRAITIILAAILFLLPLILIPILSGRTAENAAASGDIAGLTEESGASQVFYACEMQNSALDMSALESTRLPGFENAVFTMTASADAACSSASASDSALALLIGESDDGFTVRAYVPEESSLDKSDAEALCSSAASFFKLAALAAAGLSEEQLAALAAPAMLEVRSEAGSEFFVALNMILIYLNIMLIYFLVLFYGQGVANCVIMEKTSKLMDTFLVSVRPKAMIAGKMLAVFCAAVMQFISWIVALVLGIVIGGVVASSLHPGQAFSIGAILSALNGGEQLFSAGAVPVAVIMIFAGFLLYCSLAAICGSLASKPEDLSTTLTAFSLVLIASFFCTLYSGLLDGGIKAGMTWLDIVPFTSILVTPARMLLGQVSVLQGTISLVIVLAVAAAFVIAAGRLYKLMAMYKGNPPKLKQLIKMIKA